jgi:hypothetical protein
MRQPYWVAALAPDLTMLVDETRPAIGKSIDVTPRASQ